MKNFKNLQIWKRSMELVTDLYEITETFPKAELYGLTSQIRRAAVSIPSNIAEGCGKNSSTDLARFLDISLGSAFEIETQLLLSISLEYGDAKKIERALNEIVQIQKMINKYNQSLRLSSN